MYECLKKILKPTCSQSLFLPNTPYGQIIFGYYQYTDINYCQNFSPALQRSKINKTSKMEMGKLHFSCNN